MKYLFTAFIHGIMYVGYLIWNFTLPQRTFNDTFNILFIDNDHD